MHGSICVCDLMPKIETQTKLLLIIHRIEIRKPSNTGNLAASCLTNSEVIVRGHQGDPTAPLTFPEGTQPLLLFPYEDAVPITQFIGKPTILVVPDGTWRQANKVRQRVPGLASIPSVVLPPDVPSRYRLRSEAHEHGLATIEAIARAFGILEGPHVRTALEHLLDAMVDRTLWARGDVKTGDVTGGLPEGAERHDPASGLARTRAPSR